MLPGFHNRLPLMLLAVSAALLFTSTGQAQIRQQALFHIERNKNANIVRYDARIGENGRLDAKEPVVAYWVRLANEGEIKPLGFFQRKFAYGFDADYDEQTDSVAMDMAAEIGRIIEISRVGGEYRAMTNISGVRSHIDRIYISAHGRGLTTRVDSIEFFGSDVRSGVETYENYVP
jgi:uncharacterized protein (DUF1684 family)